MFFALAVLEKMERALEVFTSVFNSFHCSVCFADTLVFSLSSVLSGFGVVLFLSVFCRVSIASRDLGG